MTHRQENGHRSHGGVEVRIAAVACAAAITLSAAWPLSAHHSFSAEFDATREVKATGAVTELEWMNPHAWIHLNVQEICERRGTPGPQGDDEEEEEWACRAPSADEAAEWGFELGSPNGLMRQGWSRNSLVAGDEVTIEGTRARDDSPNANARVVTTGDGTRLFAGSSERLTP